MTRWRQKTLLTSAGHLYLELSCTTRVARADVALAMERHETLRAGAILIGIPIHVDSVRVRPFAESASS
jgi:hypothetical protein